MEGEAKVSEPRKQRLRKETGQRIETNEESAEIIMRCGRWHNNPEIRFLLQGGSSARGQAFADIEMILSVLLLQVYTVIELGSKPCTRNPVLEGLNICLL